MNAASMRTVLAVLALALPLATYAADKKSDSSSKVSRGDRNFIMQAANDSLAEIELGKLAQEKASNPEVKKFGQRMIDDHTKATQELEPIATKLGVTPPKEPTGSHARMVQGLSKRDAQRFDHDYAEAMVKDHEKAVKLFQRTSEKGESEELRQFAAKHLPVLQEHLKMAQQLRDQTKQTRQTRQSK